MRDDLSFHYYHATEPLNKYHALDIPGSETFNTYVEQVRALASTSGAVDAATTSPPVFSSPPPTKKAKHTTPGAPVKPSTISVVMRSNLLTFEDNSYLSFKKLEATFSISLVKESARKDIQQRIQTTIDTIPDEKKSDFDSENQTVEELFERNIVRLVLSRQGKETKMQRRVISESEPPEWKQVKVSLQKGSVHVRDRSGNVQTMPWEVFKTKTQSSLEPDANAREFRLHTETQFQPWKNVPEQKNYMYVLYDTLPTEEGHVTYTLRLGEYADDNDWFSKHGVLSGLQRDRLIGAGILRRLTDKVLYIDDLSGTFRPPNLGVTKTIIEAMTGDHVVEFTMKDLVKHKDTYLVGKHPDSKQIMAM